MRRISGICPPSKPGRRPPPERAFSPFMPRPDVLPIPDPGPRPTRVGLCVEPRGGLSMCSSSVGSPSGRAAAFGLRVAFAFAFGFAFGFAFAVAISSSSLGGRHLDEVSHLIEHATERRMVGLDHDVLV